jgi:methylmalonyl-CoA/ethylmalonyl-CoA epimerase
MKPTIAHLGIAVESIDQAAKFYLEVLGVKARGPEEADGAKILHLEFEGAEVELLEPLGPDSPIGRFLARRGPGIHHICYRVADLDSALVACRENGYTLIDQQPRTGAGGCRIAFVHPKATDGILIELTESPRQL